MMTTKHRVPPGAPDRATYWADMLAVLRRADPELFDTLRAAVLVGPPSEEATALEMKRYATLETAVERVNTGERKP